MPQRLTSSQPKLLFVVNAAWFFVSHRFALGLTAQRHGYDVHVAAPADSGEGPIMAAGMTFHPIALSRGRRGLASELKTVTSLVALYGRVSPQIVHHITIKPVTYGSLAARFCGVPAVINAVPGLGSTHLATGLAARLQRGIIRTLLRLGASRSTVWHIFQNRDDEMEYTSAGIAEPSRSVLIEGAGVDLRTFVPKPFSVGSPVVMLPARLLGDKGVREFVDASRILRTRGIDARFVLVGGLDPDNPSAIAADEVDSWVAEGIIEWWGARTEMADVLAEAHIVCLPSYREGMPKVLLEAAACGRPIVTTDVPGCRDVLAGAQIGLVVPARNVPALVVALEQLIVNPADRERMGAAARTRAEAAFAVEQVVNATLDLYVKASTHR
jgi:glycosyltransferase involved in cell wall biosynthesis